MLDRVFNLLTKDDHLLVEEGVTFLPSCEAVSGSARALPYMERILEGRDGKGGGGQVEEERDGGGDGRERWGREELRLESGEMENVRKGEKGREGEVEVRRGRGKMGEGRKEKVRGWDK